VGGNNRVLHRPIRSKRNSGVDISEGETQKEEGREDRKTAAEALKGRRGKGGGLNFVMDRGWTTERRGTRTYKAWKMDPASPMSRVKKKKGSVEERIKSAKAMYWRLVARILFRYNKRARR